MLKYLRYCIVSVFLHQFLCIFTRHSGLTSCTATMLPSHSSSSPARVSSCPRGTRRRAAAEVARSRGTHHRLPRSAVIYDHGCHRQNTVYNVTNRLQLNTQCAVLHTVYNFTQSVKFYTQRAIFLSQKPLLFVFG